MDESDFEVGVDRLGPAGDLFYRKLLEAHEGLGKEESQRLNMRLVLLMANAIGDAGKLDAILEAAATARGERP